MLIVKDTAGQNAEAARDWDKAAAGWNANSAIVQDWLRSATGAMMKMADIRVGMRVLDAAAGAGGQTLDIAALVGPKGSVVATDLSPNILKYAQANIANAGYRNVETCVCDCEDLPFEEAVFDAAVCRLGLMLLADPLRGIEQIHRVLKPDARLCTLVFSGPERNPCLSIMMRTAMRHAGLPAVDPFRAGSLFSLGKQNVIEELFEKAGFRHTVTTQISAPFNLPSAGRYIKFVRESGTPVVKLLERLDSKARDLAWDDIEQQLTQFNTPDGWSGPNELLITVGGK